MALIVSKHIELATNIFIKRFIHECKKVTDTHLFDKITQKEIRIRAKIPDKIMEYLQNLKLLT